MKRNRIIKNHKIIIAKQRTVLDTVTLLLSGMARSVQHFSQALDAVDGSERQSERQAQRQRIMMQMPRPLRSAWGAIEAMLCFLNLDSKSLENVVVDTRMNLVRDYCEGKNVDVAVASGAGAAKEQEKEKENTGVGGRRRALRLTIFLGQVLDVKDGSFFGRLMKLVVEGLFGDFRVCWELNISGGAPECSSTSAGGEAKATPRPGGTAFIDDFGFLLEAQSTRHADAVKMLDQDVSTYLASIKSVDGHLRGLLYSALKIAPMLLRVLQTCRLQIHARSLRVFVKEYLDSVRRQPQDKNSQPRLFVLAMLERVLPNITRAQCDHIFREVVSAFFYFITEGRPDALAHVISDVLRAVSETCGRGDTSVLASAPRCSFVVSRHMAVDLECENFSRVMGSRPHLFSDTSWIRDIATAFGGCAEASAVAFGGDLRKSETFRDSVMMRLLKRIVVEEGADAASCRRCEDDETDTAFFAHTLAAMIGVKGADATERMMEAILNEDLASLLEEAKSGNPRK